MLAQHRKGGGGGDKLLVVTGNSCGIIMKSDFRNQEQNEKESKRTEEENGSNRGQVSIVHVKRKKVLYMYKRVSKADAETTKCIREFLVFVFCQIQWARS